jgi:hypothetical protein
MQHYVSEQDAEKALREFKKQKEMSNGYVRCPSCKRFSPIDVEKTWKCLFIDCRYKIPGVPSIH